MDYYGIMFAEYDDSLGLDSQKLQDKSLAMVLITQGECIPEDLANRLLSYKNNRKGSISSYKKSNFEDSFLTTQDKKDLDDFLKKEGN